MIKKIFAAVMTAVIIMALFSGCNIRKDDEQGLVSEEILNSIKLDVSNDYDGTLNINITSEESEINTLTSIITAFNKVYPNIKVNVEQFALDSYYGKIKSNAGVAYQEKDYTKMSDVFWFAQDKIDYLYDADMLFPLSAIIEKDSNFNVDNLVDESIGVSKINNIIYLMPRDYNQVVMYFNQDIFDAAGVTYPTAQMSRTEFMTMLENLRTGLNSSNATNAYGEKYSDVCTNLIDVNCQWDSWCWPLIKQFGGEVVNSNGEAVLYSDETYNALAFWKTLRDNNYVNTVSTSNTGVSFRMQHSAVYFHARAVLSDITKTTTKIKGVQNLGVTAIPQFGSEYAIGGGASGYGMYKYAENKTEAWLFLKFVVSEAGQEAFSTTGNCVPVLKSLLNSTTAGWRTYTSAAFGTAFDNNSFVYGLDFEVKPFTSTRDFFQYIPYEIQTDVLSCIRSSFSSIDTEGATADTIKSTLESQSELIEYYINRAD